MNRSQTMVRAALLAALTCAATMIIQIPSPLQGYLNPGDCMVLCCGWLLGPVYGFLAAGIGSGLADLFSGYGLYAPATFVIKGVMAAVAYGLYTLCPRGTLSRIGSAVVAEAVMIGGYFLFESVLYGFGAAAVNVLPNLVQGLAGLILGVLLAECLQRNRLMCL